MGDNSNLNAEQQIRLNCLSLANASLMGDERDPKRTLAAARDFEKFVLGEETQS